MSRQGEKIREKERGTFRFLIADPAVFVMTQGGPSCRHFAQEAAICRGAHAWIHEIPNVANSNLELAVADRH